MKSFNCIMNGSPYLCFRWFESHRTLKRERITFWWFESSKDGLFVNTARTKFYHLCAFIPNLYMYLSAIAMPPSKLVEINCINSHYVFRFICITLYFYYSTVILLFLYSDNLVYFFWQPSILFLYSDNLV